MSVLQVHETLNECLDADLGDIPPRNFTVHLGGQSKQLQSDLDLQFLFILNHPWSIFG